MTSSSGGLLYTFVSQFLSVFNSDREVKAVEDLQPAWPPFPKILLEGSEQVAQLETLLILSLWAVWSFRPGFDSASNIQDFENAPDAMFVDSEWHV